MRSVVMSMDSFQKNDSNWPCSSSTDVWSPVGEFYKIRESLDLFSKALGKEKNMNSRASVEFFVEKKGEMLLPL